MAYIDLNYLLTRLGHAIMWNNIEEVEEVIKKCPDIVNAGGTLSNTALHQFASSFSTVDPAMLQLLLRKGANIDQPNDFGQTPIFLCQSPEAVILLAKAGANLIVRDYKNRSPLHQMVKHADLETIMALVEVMLEKGMSLEPKDIRNRTPLEFLETKGLRQNKIDYLKSKVI